MASRWRFQWQNPVHLILLGLVVRELLSFWTGHPYDLEVWLRNAYAVSLGQDPYAHLLPPVPGLSFAYLNGPIASVGYLPPWSFLVAGIYRLYLLAPQGGRYYFYFLLKQPTVLADVALGGLLYRAVLRWGGSSGQATNILRYWMLFPFAILISAVWGQFDAIVVDLLLVALLTSSWLGRYGSLGLGIVLKWFPVVLLPFFAFRERGWRRIAVLGALGLTALLTAIVFALMGWSYLGVTAMALSASHGGGGGMTYVNLLQDPSILRAWSGIPGLYEAMGFLWVPGSLVAGYVAWRRFPGSSPRGVVQGMLLVTAVFYVTRFGVYEQYLLYLLPFFLIDMLLWHPGRRAMFNFSWGLVLAYLLVNNDLLVRFAGPLYSGFVDIAYAADASPVLGGLRTAGLYALDVLITITFVQLVLVFAREQPEPQPWPVAAGRWFRHRIAPRVAETNP
jgi:hypothetical protein